VRLLEAHVLAGFGFPVRGKGFVEFDVQLAGGVVRDVEQADGCLGLNQNSRQEQRSKSAEMTEKAMGFHGSLQKGTSKIGRTGFWKRSHQKQTTVFLFVHVKKIYSPALIFFRAHTSHSTVPTSHSASTPKGA
jgi:hypothetical protein